MSIEKRLDEYLSQFNDDDQERILRYALDHIVPRMKYRTAIQQAEAQQPATPEPVLFIHPDTFAMNNAQVGAWKPGHELTGYIPLYTHPAPSVPDDVVRDAERYRWLRDLDHWPAPFSSSQEPEPVRGRDLDAAIDAAMLAAKDSK